MGDDTTTLAELKRQVADFIAERDWQVFHNPKNLSMSIAIEAAELMEHFQWLSLEQSRQYCRQGEAISQVREELADVLCYCLSLANVLGIDLSEAVSEKLSANALRFPPEQFRGRFGPHDRFNRPADPGG